MGRTCSPCSSEPSSKLTLPSWRSITSLPIRHHVPCLLSFRIDLRNSLYTHAMLPYFLSDPMRGLDELTRTKMRIQAKPWFASNMSDEDKAGYLAQLQARHDREVSEIAARGEADRAQREASAAALKALKEERAKQKQAVDELKKKEAELAKEQAAVLKEEKRVKALEEKAEKQARQREEAIEKAKRKAEQQAQQAEERARKVHLSRLQGRPSLHCRSSLNSFCLRTDPRATGGGAESSSRS